MYTEAIQEERYAGIVSFSYADGLEGDWGILSPSSYISVGATSVRSIREE